MTHGGWPAFTKNIPLKSVTYDAATDTVYLVPMNKVKPKAKWRDPFQVVSPNPAISPGFSNLTDTSGNPIAANDPSTLLRLDGVFAATPRVAKASPAVLSYLFGTPYPQRSQAKLGHTWLDAPVLNFRSRDSPEIGQVPGAQGRIVGECECSDFEVHRTDTQARAAECAGTRPQPPRRSRGAE